MRKMCGFTTFQQQKSYNLETIAQILRKFSVTINIHMPYLSELK